MNKTYRLEAEFVGNFHDAAVVQDAIEKLIEAVPTLKLLRLSEYNARKDKPEG